MFLFSLQIRLMRVFGRIKQTQSYGFVPHFYFRQPFFILFTNALKSAGIFSVFTIMRILNICCFPQITKTIVGAHTVYVIDLIFWPRISFIQPRQSVRQIQHVIQPDNYISVLGHASCAVAHTATPPRFSPHKHASIRIVLQKFFNAIRCHAVNINRAVHKGQAA